jgi:hypothetical protein
MVNGFHPEIDAARAASIRFNSLLDTYNPENSPVTVSMASRNPQTPDRTDLLSDSDVLCGILQKMLERQKLRDDVAADHCPIPKPKAPGPATEAHRKRANGETQKQPHKEKRKHKIESANVHPRKSHKTDGHSTNSHKTSRSEVGSGGKEAEIRADKQVHRDKLRRESETAVEKSKMGHDDSYKAKVLEKKAPIEPEKPSHQTKRKRESGTAADHLDNNSEASRKVPKISNNAAKVDLWTEAPKQKKSAPKQSFRGPLTNSEKKLKAAQDAEREKKKEAAAARRIGKTAERKKVKEAAQAQKAAKASGVKAHKKYRIAGTGKSGDASKIPNSARSQYEPKSEKKEMQSRSFLTGDLFDKKEENTSTMYTEIEEDDDADVPEEKRSSVLYRPTPRAMFFKEQQSAKNEALEEAGIAPEPKRTGRFRFLDLDRKIRDEIYALAVVNRTCFKWPVDSHLDRRQPDLAMVCRQMRQEVLPLYYLENHFAMALPGVIQDDKPSEKMVLLEKWLNAIGDPKNEEGKWLDNIQRWVFDGAWKPVNEEAQIDPTAAEYAGDQPFPAKAKEADGRAKPAPRLFNRSPLSKKFILHAEYSSKTEDGVKLRIHRQAACILPQFSGPDKRCRLQQVPESVRITLSAWRGFIAGSSLPTRAKRLTRLVGKLNNLTPDLAGACCKPCNDGSWPAAAIVLD